MIRDIRESVPRELTAEPQWILWREEERRGKPTKVPFQTGGLEAKSDDPKTWATFDQARAAFNPNLDSGIGFVFSHYDKFVGIDLDGCRDPDTGTIAAWAWDVIQKIDSYTEISPSGTGVKIWARGTSPFATGKNKKLPEMPVVTPLKEPGIEIYDKLRYFAVTGERLDGVSPNIEDRDIRWLKDRFWPVPVSTIVDKHNPSSHSSVMERARKYVEKMPSAISGQNGHGQTFHVACVLVLGFDLNQSQALGILHEYNQRCEPPWSEQELRHKVESADAQNDERGYLLKASSVANWRQTESVHHGAQTEHVHNCEQDESGHNCAPFEMKAITAAELDATDYEVNYLVDGVLVEGQPVIVGGKQKTLKTSLLVALSVALVLAQKFLGVFDVPRACRVGFVSCESGLGVLQETLRRVCIAYGCALGDLSGLVVSDTIPRLDDPACIAAIESFCTDHELNVLILDPAYLMMSGADAGNLLVMGERLAALNRIASHAGVTVILAHHLKKTRVVDGDRYAPPQLEEIAWSGFAEFARQWLLLGRRCEYEDGSGQHDLWMRAGGSAGHSGLWGVDVSEGLRSDPGGRHWDVEVRAGSEIVQEQKNERANKQGEKQRKKDEANQIAVVDALSKLPKGEGAFPFKLRTMAGVANERLHRALHLLEQAGTVEPCKALRSPTHKTPQEGAWRLTEDWWNDD